MGVPATVLSALCATLALFAPAAAPAGSMIAPGEAFPDWQLVDHRGTDVSSASLTGKRYLVWFYPKAMTPG